MNLQLRQPISHKLRADKVESGFLAVSYGVVQWVRPSHVEKACELLLYFGTCVLTGPSARGSFGTATQAALRHPKGRQQTKGSGGDLVSQTNPPFGGGVTVWLCLNGPWLENMERLPSWLLLILSQPRAWCRIPGSLCLWAKGVIRPAAAQGCAALQRGGVRRSQATYPQGC